MPEYISTPETADSLSVFDYLRTHSSVFAASFLLSITIGSACGSACSFLYFSKLKEDQEQLREIDTVPCSIEQTRVIQTSVRLVTSDIRKQAQIIYDIYSGPDSTKQKAFLERFPTLEDFIEVIDDYVLNADKTQFYCSPRRDSGWRGITYKYAEGDQFGVFVIYPETFEAGDCRVVGTTAHELGHIFSMMSMDHSDKIRSYDDWIFYLGEFYSGKCDIQEWTIDGGSTK